jgi:release factor glutamine methyltransferase
VNLPHARVFATDLSASALEVAERNCRRHQVGAQVTLLHGDLLDPLPEIVHLIVANLPYVSESEVALLAPEITRYEPRAAYMGGRGGLEAIELLLERASRLLLNGGAVLLEIGHDQAQALAAGARKRFPGSRIDVLKDLSGLDRVLVIL